MAFFKLEFFESSGKIFKWHIIIDRFFFEKNDLMFICTKYSKLSQKSKTNVLYKAAHLPRCVLMEAYLAVPVKPFPSLYLMCSPWELMNFLASPKSMIKIRWAFLPAPLPLVKRFENSNMIKLKELTNCEIVGFDVSVNDSSTVNVLDSLNHLISQHEHRFSGELFTNLCE